MIIRRVNTQQTSSDLCPKCGSPLGEITTTQSGRKLQRCSAGRWNADTRKTEGCDYVKWLEIEPEKLNEKCPKCGSPLLLVVTRYGKKMKKCSTNVWDPNTRQASGCDFVEWIKGTTEPLDEKCPECANPLVLFTTSAGKKMKKCSMGGWDKVARKATGCTFIQWLQ